MTAEFTAETSALITARSGGVCEMCGEDPAVQKHHRRARGMGGTRRPQSASPANALDLCRDCHHFTEVYRRLARLLGWLVPQHADPAVVPVVYRGERVLLTDDGGIEAV